MPKQRGGPQLLPRQGFSGVGSIVPAEGSHGFSGVGSIVPAEGSHGFSGVESIVPAEGSHGFSGVGSVVSAEGSRGSVNSAAALCSRWVWGAFPGRCLRWRNEGVLGRGRPGSPWPGMLFGEGARAITVPPRRAGSRQSRAAGAAGPQHGAPNENCVISSGLAFPCDHTTPTSTNDAHKLTKLNISNSVSHFLVNSVKFLCFLTDRYSQRACVKSLQRQRRSKTWSCNNSAVNVCTVHEGTRPFLKNNSDTPE